MGASNENATVLFSLLFVSCNSDSTINAEPEMPAYVQHEVLFSVHDDVSFQKAYEDFAKLDLQLKQANDFNYYVVATSQNAEIIKTTLNSKTYLTKNGRIFYSAFSGDTLSITVSFSNPNIDEVTDWFNTTRELNLKNKITANSFKWGVLGVPKGEEKVWVDRLMQNPIVKTAGLNYIYSFDR